MNVLKKIKFCSILTILKINNFQDINNASRKGDLIAVSGGVVEQAGVATEYVFK